MKAGEYAISKDLNVALWEEFMKNSKKKTLQEIYGGDFVIINEELHGQFDEFKKNIVPANHTCSIHVACVAHQRMCYNQQTNCYTCGGIKNGRVG